MKKKLLAFTLAEAVLTMTILGVLAATMVANLKPAQYRTKGLVTKAQKVYSDLDQATNMIISECTQSISLAQTYKSCTRTGTPVARTSVSAAEWVTLYDRYMRFTSASYSKDGYSCKVTKSNAAICFNAGTTIWIDVNNTEGPNVAGQDQHSFTLDNNGIASTMPSVEAAAINAN